MKKTTLFMALCLLFPTSTHAGKKNEEDSWDKAQREKQEQQACDKQADSYYWWKAQLEGARTELGKEKILREMRKIVKDYTKKCLEKDYINPIELN